MDHKGIIKRDFETSISYCCLTFQDAKLEEAYKEAKVQFTMITVASKRFMIAIIVGYFLLALIDITSALGVNPDYTFATETWVFYSLLIPTAILEIIFYNVTSCSSVRGVAYTLIGCAVIFHNNYYDFESEAFYPFVGTE